jgi:hypothetical protein
MSAFSPGNSAPFHRPFTSREFNRAVVVAVIAVRMVQVAVDEIVDVIPVRHRFMAAPWSVNVARLVTAAARRALVRIFGAQCRLEWNLTSSTIMAFAVSHQILREPMFDVEPMH